MLDILCACYHGLLVLANGWITNDALEKWPDILQTEGKKMVYWFSKRPNSNAQILFRALQIGLFFFVFAQEAPCEWHFIINKQLDINDVRKEFR